MSYDSRIGNTYSQALYLRLRDYEPFLPIHSMADTCERQSLIVVALYSTAPALLLRRVLEDCWPRLLGLMDATEQQVEQSSPGLWLDGRFLTRVRVV